MGLDTFADIGEKTDKKAVLVTIKDHDGKDRQVINNALYAEAKDLCGGMLSGGGASFRGKVYDEVVEMVTEQSLYQERIENETVQVMAMKLKEYADALDDKKKDKEIPGLNYEITVGEVKSLATWFEVTADNGMDVVGWW